MNKSDEAILRELQPQSYTTMLSPNQNHPPPPRPILKTFLIFSHTP